MIDSIFMISVMRIFSSTEGAPFSLQFEMYLTLNWSMRDCNAYWLFWGPISTSLFENPMGDSPLSLAKLTSSSNFSRLNPRADTLEYLLIGEFALSNEENSLAWDIIGNRFCNSWLKKSSLEKSCSNSVIFLLVKKTLFSLFTMCNIISLIIWSFLKCVRGFMGEFSGPRFLVVMSCEIRRLI